MASIPLHQVVERADEVGRNVLALHADKADREARWPEESIRALLEAGLGGLVVPERFGGLGHGLLALARVCEILGRYCASTAICYGMHAVGSAVLAAKPTDEQADRFLVPIARNEHLTTLSLSEPGTGVHFYYPQARLEPSADGFTLTGTKVFVTNGSHADSYVVSSALETEGVPAFTCVVLPSDARGMAWGEPWSGFGMRGNDARTLRLEAVPVPPGQILGRVGDEMWYVLNVIAPFFLVAMSGTYLGTSAAALDLAIEHLKSRKHDQSGKALADQPVLQHKVGELWAIAERSRQLLLHAATQADTGAPDAPLSLFAAKAEIAEASETITSGAMAMMGGFAYREHGSVQRALRDARAAHIMAPTTEILRSWTGRWLLERPVFGE